jgi:hypothetical protein
MSLDCALDHITLIGSMHHERINRNEQDLEHLINT